MKELFLALRCLIRALMMPQIKFERFTLHTSLSRSLSPKCILKSSIINIWGRSTQNRLNRLYYDSEQFTPAELKGIFNERYDIEIVKILQTTDGCNELEHQVQEDRKNLSTDAIITLENILIYDGLRSSIKHVPDSPPPIFETKQECIQHIIINFK